MNRKVTKTSTTTTLGNRIFLLQNMKIIDKAPNRQEVEKRE